MPCAQTVMQAVAGVRGAACLVYVWWLVGYYMSCNVGLVVGDALVVSLSWLRCLCVPCASALQSMCADIKRSKYGSLNIFCDLCVHVYSQHTVQFFTS